MYAKKEVMILLQRNNKLQGACRMEIIVKNRTETEFKLNTFRKDLSVSRIANIHYFEFTQEYHTFRDRHPFRELVYTDSGSIQVSAESYSGLLKENQLIIHKANEVHSLSCPCGIAPNVIIIGFECTCPALDPFSENPCFLTQEQQALLADIIREGRNVFLPPYDVPNLKDMKKRPDFLFGADQMIQLKLETLFISLIRSRQNTNEKVPMGIQNPTMVQIGSYIENHFREEITLRDLCFLFGLNKTTFCAAFKEAYGETAVTHINKRRIKEAKRLMRSGSCNLTQIANESGFSSIHYFSRTFHRYEGKSPSEYIRTVKARLMM